MVRHPVEKQMWTDIQVGRQSEPSRGPLLQVSIWHGEFPGVNLVSCLWPLIRYKELSILLHKHEARSGSLYEECSPELLAMDQEMNTQGQNLEYTQDQHNILNEALGPKHLNMKPDAEIHL